MNDKEKLEFEKIRQEEALFEQHLRNVESSIKVENMMNGALSALKKYAGVGDD
jgi:hypothetical protein